MKKSSKLISLLLALVLAVSCFAGVSAVTASAADEENRIYFEVPTLESWGTAKSCFAHIYNVYGDGDLVSFAWNTKPQRCTYDEEKGLYYYDLNKLYELDENGEKVYRGLLDGCDYAVIFAINNTAKAVVQTCNVTLSTECIGGTISVTGNMIENTEDSSKLDYEAVWTDSELAAKYGPKAAITSTGRIVGQYFPMYQAKEQIVSQFLKSWAVVNATLITPEIVQADCEALGVEPEAVYLQYANDYATELADPATYTDTASLETVAYLLGVNPDDITEPTTTEAPTEPTTTEAPTEPTTTEAPTEPTTTEAPTEPTTTEAPTEPTTTEAPTEVTTTEPAPVYLYGDANMDCVITVADATLIQKIGINMAEADATTLILSDVNGDGRVSIMDVTLVQKYLADLGYNTALVGQPATV